MRSKFLGHLILIVLLNLLIKPIAIFGIDAQVQNTVGASEYGFYFSLLNFTYLFNILLDFGITNFNTKYVAQYPHLAQKYIGKIMPLRLGLFFLYVLVTISLALGLNYNERQFEILYILIGNQFLVSVILYLRSYFSGLLYLKIDILLSVLDKFFLILSVGYFLYFNTGFEMTIKRFVMIQSCTLLLTLSIALVLLISKIGFPKIKWSLSFNRMILKQSFPYALLIVLMMLYNRVDSVMLERMLPNGDYEAGIYAQAYRLLDAFFMFASLFSSLLFPLFSKIIKEKQEVKNLLASASNILLPMAIILAGVCFVDWKFLLQLIYQHDIQYSGEVFRILMFSFIPICITLLFGTLLTVNGNLKLLNWVSFSGILANVILNTLFIPKYGALGATYTSLITQSLVALIQFIFVIRVLKIEIHFITIARYLGLIVLLIAIPFTLKFFNVDWNKSLVILLLCFIYLFLSRLFDWRNVMELIASKKRNLN